MAADTSRLVVGSTYRFQLTATKDGEVWDLSAATVKLCLKDPSGNTSEHAATVTDGPGGAARYDCATTDLDEAGRWTRSWHVTDGAVVQETEPIPFWVLASP